MPAPEKGESWGIFGGTFDPVHLGHIQLTVEIKQSINLEGILLVPSFNHPFKTEKTKASYNDRVKILELAVNSYNFFEICHIEKDENLSGYTIDTIKALQNKYPGTEFSFIIGADNIAGMKNWREPDKIVESVKVISGCRPSCNNKVSEDSFSSMIEYVKTSMLDISSTDIKAMLSKNRNDSSLLEKLHPDVYNYIIENRLYL